jgi:ubiquitin fusion degradation protein 1
MMRNLLLSDGDMIQVEYAKLANANFVKFQPQNVDFLEISNPTEVYLHFAYSLSSYKIIL